MEENTLPWRRFQTFSIFSDFLWEGLRQVKKQHFKVKLLDLGSFNSLEQHAMCKHFFLLQKSLHPTMQQSNSLLFSYSISGGIWWWDLSDIYLELVQLSVQLFVPPPSPTAILFLFKIYIGKIFIPMFSYPPMQCIYINFSFLVHNTIKCSIRKNISHSSGVFLQRFKGIVCLFWPHRGNNFQPL